MIKLNYSGKEYVLEYDKDSIITLERLGFTLEKLSEQPMTMFPLVFRGAFYKNHKTAKQEDIDAIFKNLKKRNELVSALIRMINEQYEKLMSDNDNEGNLNWEIV